MSSKLGRSVIQGQPNKAANRDSKYITAHFSPPELNWQCWFSETGPGTTAHTALWNGEKGGQLRRGSQDAALKTSTACCMTWVGTQSELVHCLLPVPVCVCDYDGFFLGKSCSRKQENHSFFLLVLTAATPLLLFLFVSVATGFSHAPFFRKMVLNALQYDAHATVTYSDRFLDKPSLSAVLLVMYLLSWWKWFAYATNSVRYK